MDNLDTDIKGLEAQIRELQSKQFKLKDELRKLQLMRVYRDYKVKRGSIVTHQNAEYKVASIDVSFGGKPWLKGYKRKKDGGWGKIDIHLYTEWEVKDES
jgi:hypothetical protein